MNERDTVCYTRWSGRSGAVVSICHLGSVLPDEELCSDWRTALGTSTGGEENKLSWRWWIERECEGYGSEAERWASHRGPGER